MVTLFAKCIFDVSLHLCFSTRFREEPSRGRSLLDLWRGVGRPQEWGGGGGVTVGLCHGRGRGVRHKFWKEGVQPRP